MKKLSMLSVLLFGIFFLAGCGTQQANQNQPIINTPTPAIQEPASSILNEDQDSNTNKPTTEIVKVNINDIRNAFARKYPSTDYSKSTITIEKNSENLFVFGKVFIPAGGGGVYWATKVNGVWTIVFDGQDTPTCSLLKTYNFPATFTTDCH